MKRLPELHALNAVAAAEPNPYELARSWEKAARILRAVIVAERKMDLPVRLQVFTPADLSDDTWALMERLAHVNPCGAETRALVVKLLAER